MKKLLTILIVLFSIQGFSQTKLKRNIIEADTLTVNYNAYVPLATDSAHAVQFYQFNSLETSLSGRIEADSIRLEDQTKYFEKQLTDAETAITVGFELESETLVLFNGQAIDSAQWSGRGTTSITLILDTKLYDNLIIKK